MAPPRSTLGRLLRLLVALVFMTGVPAAAFAAPPAGAATEDEEEQRAAGAELEAAKAAPVENRIRAGRPVVRRSTHGRTPNAAVPPHVLAQPRAAAALANGLGTFYRL